jgi:Protein of unknown function (DUF4242)
MRYLIVEYAFDPPVTDALLEMAFSSLKPCLEVRNIRRLRSWVSEDRSRAICEYEAADTQAVRDAYQVAQVPYRNVWAGNLFEFNPPTPAV